MFKNKLLWYLKLWQKCLDTAYEGDQQLCNCKIVFIYLHNFYFNDFIMNNLCGKTHLNYATAPVTIP